MQKDTASFFKKEFVMLFEWGCGIAKAWQSKYTLHACTLTSRLYGRERPTLTRISMARQGKPWFNGRVYANAKFILKCFYFNNKKIPNSNFKNFCLRAGEDCQPDKFLHFPSSVHTHTYHHVLWRQIHFLNALLFDFSLNAIAISYDETPPGFQLCKRKESCLEC